MNLDELDELVESIRRDQSEKKHTVRVCMAAGCQSSGANDVVDSLDAHVKHLGWQDRAEVKCVGCMGLCSAGPLV